tara:strand:+ start:34402 stop:35592 length:1191 start_codon:yes stop_codon:yes gene_type:complete
MKKFKLVLFPTNLDELEKFVNSKYDLKNKLVISLNVDITTYCISNNLEFLLLKDLVNEENFKKTDINNELDIILKSNNFFVDKIQRKYYYHFKYMICHILRNLLLANEIEKSLKKISFDKIYFFKSNYSLPYSRNNLNFFLNSILSNSFKDKLFKPYYNNMIIAISAILIQIIIRFKSIFFGIEFFLKKITFKKYVKKSKIDDKKKILFFSAGRDFIFHSKLTSNSEFNSICVKGSSIFNKESINNFKQIVNYNSILFDGFFKNYIDCKIKYKHMQVIFSNFKSFNSLENNFKKLLLNYILFRIFRDYEFINSTAHIIKKINPKIVFSSSLALPLISANLLGIKTISEFEGYGIEQNPMAPYIGDYIFSPSIYTDKMVKKYLPGDGEIIKSGAYYL